MAAPALLGFGLFLAWGTCAPLVQNLLGTRVPGFGPLVSPLLHALFLLAFAVAFNYRRRDLYSPWLVGLLGACIAAGVGLRVVAAGGWAFLTEAAGILEAVARAGLFLLWVEQYARFAQRTAWPAYALSFCLVPVAYFAVVSLPAAVGFGVVYAMLAGSCALLWVCGYRAACGEALGEAVSAACTWRVPWRPAVLMAAFSFACYMLMHLTGIPSAMGELGNLLAAAGMLALCFGAFDRINLHVLYKVFLSLSVYALLVYAQGVWPLGDVAGLLSYAGFNGFTLLVLFVLNGICYRYGVRAVWLFGVVRACEVAAHALGSALGSSLAQLDGAQPLLVAAAVDGTAAVLVVLGIFLLSEHDFSSTWGVAPVGRREGPAAVVAEQPAAPEGLSEVARPLLGSYYEDFVWRCSRVARHYGLTHREEEILALLAQDKTSAEIEATLFISHNTAKGRLRHVYDKLGVHSREEAAAVVREWR